MIIVTSWDDGYPADMKIAELLDRHGLTGTFFVPIKNSENLPVLNTTDLRQLDSRFEIGSHTYNHTRLNNIENNRVDEEIRAGKITLEDILGHSVEGFCYPGGYITPHAERTLRKHGVRYARTIENFRFDCGTDSYHVPTTIQIFPHKKHIYIKNLLKRGNFNKRWDCFRYAISCDSLWELLDLIAEDCSKRDGVLHLWGHSWEIEQLNLWEELDSFLSRIKQYCPVSKCVGDSIDINTKQVHTNH